MHMQLHVRRMSSHDQARASLYDNTLHIWKIGVRFVVQHRSSGVHAQVPRAGRRAGEVQKWNGDGLVFSCREFRLPEDDRSSCEQLFSSVVS